MSSGIGTGPAFILNSELSHIKQTTVSPEEKEDGWARFSIARQDVLDYLQAGIESESKEQSEIFTTYCMMLTDPEFLKLVQDTYKSHNFNIEWILSQKVEEYADMLRNSGVEYLAERASDITDVYGKVLNILTHNIAPTLENIPENSVLIAKSLNPSDALVFSQKPIAALITEDGGMSSHVAILARAYKVPYISGVKDCARIFQQDEQLIVDADKGQIIRDPDDETTVFYESSIQKAQKEAAELEKFIFQPAMTKDGTSFQIFANIASVQEAELALQDGADGIGLFRTEFLFMKDSSITEEEQFLAYSKVLTLMGDKPVTIRTLDAGADKEIALTNYTPVHEENPLLGLRAIRFCFAHEDLFKSQLRALYRASTFGNLKIMIPLISSVEELDPVLLLIKEVQDELTEANIPFKKDTPLGIMIETPAAVLVSDFLAEKVSFFSIGSNDLTQYTIAVDRENASVTPLFNELHPAVLRLITTTHMTAASANIQLSVCGEFAGNQEGIIFLAGLGIRTLSMSASRIAKAKAILASYDITDLTHLSKRLLQLPSTQAVQAELDSFITKKSSSTTQEN